MKSANFPRVTYISFKESQSTRDHLSSQLQSRGIYNHKMVERYDGTAVNYHNSPIVNGPHIRDISSEVLAATMSHVKAVHDWYTTTKDEIGFFCEDDIKFDMIDQWNFSWDEFMLAVPRDWEVLQLSIIRSVPLVLADMKLRTRRWDDWSCRAYVLKRSHAERILKDYYQNGVFTLDIKGTNHIPLPENIIYTKDHFHTYTIPLFTENRKDKMDAMNGQIIKFVEKIQNDSYTFIANWWEETGSKLNLYKVLDYNAGFDWGVTSTEYINLFTQENFIDRTYERLYKIKEGDIVLDIGANYGSFSYSLTNNKPKHIFCLEPSNVIFNTLRKNLSNLPCTFLNKGISNINSDQLKINHGPDHIYHHDGNTYATITFKSLIEDYGIESVDFLKFDCEGGELHIFTKENVELIKRTVKNIAGEYHIVNIPNSIASFIEFRDNYLLDLRGTDRLRVYERDGRDVSEEIFDDNFLIAYEEWWRINNPYKGQFMVYANFENADGLDKKQVSVKEKIPVIGTAVVNSVSWVSRLLNSVDYPVENFVIINNNGRGELDKELNDLASTPHKYIDNIKVVHMPSNIGCAGAWNLIIKCYMNSPYWVITNDDVAFKPGLLEEMNTLALTDNEFGTIHPNAGDFDIGAWDLFIIHERAIQALGLFDENTYPAYCEDADYIMRMTSSGMKKIVGLKNTYLHGTGEAKDYYVHGRQTEKSNETLKGILQKANLMNIEYLTRKWGPGWRKVDPQKIPFADEEKDISYSMYDLKFVRQKHTGF